jgi:hypothetical protein
LQLAARVVRVRKHGRSGYAAHPGAWSAAGCATGAAWRAATWGALAPWCGISAAPVYYDYGNTVVYQGGDVYVNGDDAGTASGYAQQATMLAGEGAQAQPSAEDQWQPLGVFALSPAAVSCTRLRTAL